MEEQEDKFLEDVYYLLIGIWALPKYLYRPIAERLLGGVRQGYGDLGSFKFGSPEYNVLKNLHTNIYQFSAAKTFHLTHDASLLRLDKNGRLKTFEEFKKDAKKIYKLYNDEWLKVEYDAAIAQSNAIAEWDEIMSEGIKYLEYVTQRDERVREDHKKLDGTTKAVNDPFWDYAYPPNGYNCRCFVRKLKKAEVTDTPEDAIDDVNSNFRFNPGKNNKVFETEGKAIHPYFKVEKGFKRYRDRNFDLDIPNL